MDPARIQCYAENRGPKQVRWRGQVMRPEMPPVLAAALQRRETLVVWICRLKMP